MHIRRILMHMRTTLIINERLLEHARELTGIQEKIALVRASLEAWLRVKPANVWRCWAGPSPNCPTFQDGGLPDGTRRYIGLDFAGAMTGRSLKGICPMHLLIDLLFENCCSSSQRAEESSACYDWNL